MEKNKGFTLLEVLIAIAIMVMALGAILAIEGSGINDSERARQNSVVAMLARNEMIQTELDIEGKTFDEVEKELTGKFDTPFEVYGWKRTVKEITFPNITSLNAQDSGKNEGEDQASGMLSKLISNYLSKAMREVTVTVLWHKGTHEQSFSVSTYWVDLNHEFNLSE